MSIQSDNKTIIVGAFTTYQGYASSRIVRVDTLGNADLTYVVGSGFNMDAFQVVCQPDNKAIVVGQFTTYTRGSTYSCSGIARLNTDGSFDATFNIGTGASGGSPSTSINRVIIQPNGKIVIGGEFTSFNGTSVNRIVRLNSDGSIDNTFNPGSGTNGTVQALAWQPDGKIIIGGKFTTVNGTARNYVARLNSDGSLDATFSIGSGANNYLVGAAVQLDGKVVIGGAFTSYNGTSRFRIARLNSNGSLDNTFMVSGGGVDNDVNGIIIVKSGQMFIRGPFANYGDGVTTTAVGGLARLNSNGTLDTSFNPGGTSANGSVRGFAVQKNGKIVIAGLFTIYNSGGTNTTRNRIARLISSSPPIILPVRLISFEAERNNEAVTLKWATASEENNMAFEVERSTDGVNFSSICTIPGKGNSAAIVNYAATDARPLKGTSYYRLKQTDFNGNFAYSRLATVYIPGNKLEVFYDAASSEIHVINPAHQERVNISIYDIRGKKIFGQNFYYAEEQIVIPLDGSLQHGIYIIDVYDQNEIKSRKIVL